MNNDLRYKYIVFMFMVVSIIKITLHPSMGRPRGRWKGCCRFCSERSWIRQFRRGKSSFLLYALKKLIKNQNRNQITSSEKVQIFHTYLILSTELHGVSLNQVALPNRPRFYGPYIPLNIWQERRPITSVSGQKTSISKYLRDRSGILVLVVSYGPGISTSTNPPD